MRRQFEFGELGTADLVVDAVYKGGLSGNAGDDPIARLLPCGNQGGFRFKRARDGRVLMVVLFTTLGHQDWPDSLDLERGRLTYYGDNRSPGRELHDTPRGGNRLLRDFFASTSSREDRANVPPCFVFSRGAIGRDVVFRGMAVPGSEDIGSRDGLVAVWRDSGGQRFQNYRAVFTMLDVPVVSREWVTGLSTGPGGDGAPTAWTLWKETGRFATLRAPKVSVIRTRTQQEPDEVGAEQLRLIRAYFGDDHTAFEPCAARLFQLAESNPVDFEITARSRDGGRDAVGRLYLGANSDGIHLDFSLEAKCYGPGSSVGVREMSRLISRLKHRQFGVLVTTSFVDRQAYEEVRDDGHPIVIMAGRDIVAVLREHGVSTRAETESWLSTNFDRSRRVAVTPTPTA